MPKIDKETRDVLTEQEKIKKLTEHEGWGFVRDAFKRRAASLLNLADITNPVPEQIVQIVGSRQLAAKMLLEVLSEIEGKAEQFNANSNLAKDINDHYILRVNRQTIDL